MNDLIRGHFRSPLGHPALMFGPPVASGMPSEVGIVNEADMDWQERTHGEEFQARSKWLRRETGGERLGGCLYEVDPGKRQCPFHYEVGNEEAMYVLEGEATLRTLDEEISITAGDFVTFPAGEGGAHQVINTSDDPVRYLFVSTERDPHVILYPDSEKLLVVSDNLPGTELMLSAEDELEYWDGE